MTSQPPTYTEVFSPAASVHREDDERGGGDVADAPGAESDAAQGLDGFQQSVAAFGGRAESADQEVPRPVVGAEVGALNGTWIPIPAPT